MCHDSTISIPFMAGPFTSTNENDEGHFVLVMFFPGSPIGEVPIYHDVPCSGKMWLD